MQTVLPDADWRPILLAGLFKLNGRTSWYLAGPPDQRRARMAEIERRAMSYGLPPIQWFTELPQSLLNLGRAATVAKREGQGPGFSLAVFRAIFGGGEDPSTPVALARLAEDSGIDGELMLRRIGEQDVKDELRRVTEEAHAAGVPGVPTVVIDGEAFWGEDRLDEAAAVASPE